MREPNEDEQIVWRHLIHRGFADIEYEPDGNVTPDFLVDGRIAVEVRRLNQNEVTETGIQALDKRGRKLASRLEMLLPSFGPPTDGRSWYVYFAYRRPFPPWPILASGVRSVVLEFRKDPDKRPLHYTVCEILTLELIPAGGPRPGMSVPGGSSDGDTGGLVVDELGKNVELCLQEKTSKMAKVRGRYPEWWIVFVDRIGYDFNDHDRPIYENALRVRQAWDKVVLVSPFNLRSWIELPGLECQDTLLGDDR